jgi:hypothetical protein
MTVFPMVIKNFGRAPYASRNWAATGNRRGSSSPYEPSTTHGISARAAANRHRRAAQLTPIYQWID